MGGVPMSKRRAPDAKSRWVGSKLNGLTRPNQPVAAGATHAQSRSHIHKGDPGQTQQILEIAADQDIHLVLPHIKGKASQCLVGIDQQVCSVGMGQSR